MFYENIGASIFIMVIKLYNNHSPSNAINKNIQEIKTISGSLRDSASYIDPEILINGNYPDVNYFYIPEFKRYYFVVGCSSYRNGLYILKGHCDVLYTYRSSILGSTAYIRNTASADLPYVNSDRVRYSEQKTTSIIQFPNGLKDSGEFILITAGG